jgi:hypothetical protein
MIADEQPLGPSPTRPTPQPSPNRVEQHPCSETRDQRRLVEFDAAVTRLQNARGVNW